MKKLDIAIAVMLAAGAATAQTHYQDAVRKREVCKEMGNYAVDTYRMKQAGESWERLNTNPNVPARMKAIKHYAYFKATDEKNAYIAAWAWCMDDFRH